MFLAACPSTTTSSNMTTTFNPPADGALLPAGATPPTAKKVPKNLEKHGDVRVDNYYWLRDDTRKDPEILAYLEAENAYVKKALAPVKALEKTLFEELKGRIKKDDSSVPTKVDSYWYYSRFEAGKEYRIHCRRKGDMKAAEQVILDQNVRAKGKEYYAVARTRVSHDENLLAFTEDTVSRRLYTLRVKDLSTGKVLADEVKDTSGAFEWGNDNKTLFYVKKEKGTLRPYQVWRHVLGTPSDQDVMVHHEKDDTFYVSIGKTKSKKYVLITMDSTLTSEVLALDADAPMGVFKPVVPRERGHEYSVWHDPGRGDRFLIRSNWKAKNFRLMAAPTGSSADRSTWKELIAHRDSVLFNGVSVFEKFLVVSERKDAMRQLRIMPWEASEDAKEHYVAFDAELYMATIGWNPDFKSTSLRFDYESPVTPPSVFEYDMVSRERKLLKQDQVLGGFKSDNYATERAWAPARDGQKIPVSIVYRKGFKKDGSHALYQYAYGSYGYSLDPWFSSTYLSLMDRGFAVAIVHVRGGQEMGRRWYEDGRQLTKQNTFNDFIDATKFLIADKYSSADRIIAGGGSAGGMLMGGIANMAPELYRGVLAQVPFVDVVTTMLDESIPLTTGEYDEWGNPNDKKFYDYMKSYSPYDNVKAQKYPHMLVITGLHDSQVQYWEPAKWVAKLRAHKTDDNLLLFDTDMAAGHGGASGRFKRLEKYALSWAWMLYITGAVK